MLALIVAGQAGPEPVEGASTPSLSEDRGWIAGSVESQLDADPTLVPFGKGSLFVPAMTDPLDEPPVLVLSGGERIAEGTTGQRIVLGPGAYEVVVGTGAREERIRINARVEENRTTVLPAAWAGLQVHVVDPRFSSLRGSYELIRVDDREYVGLGFGADEQAGEPVSTWILRPGLYKIVRVGETYRARRDFSTVRLLEGQLTHFVLVVDEATGDFLGGGEVPDDELFRARQGFFGSLVVGGDLSLNDRRKVLGSPDGLGLSLRTFLDGRLSFEIAQSPLVLQLQIEEGQSKTPDLPFQKTSDRADVDALYVYRLEPWVGPYARFGGETNLLPGTQPFDVPTDLVLIDTLGNARTECGATELQLSKSFGLTTLKEGAGLNLRVFKSIFGESTIRAGVGARHRLTRELFEPLRTSQLGEVCPSPASSRVAYVEVGPNHQVGVEGTLVASARLTRWVLANLELDSLLPFDDATALVVEANASVALKLTSYVSVNYVFRFLRDRALSPDDRIQQDVLVRFSLELL
ncbi:MAG: hypothetical protein HYV07_31795 [Deltaproteobacteria bacterium]|nr:hypothetical protein [Deltaproteobacteria bacterium]